MDWLVVVFSTLLLYIAERMIIRILVKSLISEYTDTRENVAHSLSTDIIFNSDGTQYLIRLNALFL